jgi:hypothetical protein
MFVQNLALTRWSWNEINRWSLDHYFLLNTEQRWKTRMTLYVWAPIGHRWFSWSGHLFEFWVPFLGFSFFVFMEYRSTTEFPTWTKSLEHFRRERNMQPAIHTYTYTGRRHTKTTSRIQEGLKLLNMSKFEVNVIFIRFLVSNMSIRMRMSGLIWLRVGAERGLLWARYWTFGFHKTQTNSRVAEGLATSREGLSATELAN